MFYKCSRFGLRVHIILRFVRGVTLVCLSVMTIGNLVCSNLAIWSVNWRKNLKKIPGFCQFNSDGSTVYSWAIPINCFSAFHVFFNSIYSCSFIVYSKLWQLANSCSYWPVYTIYLFKLCICVQLSLTWLSFNLSCFIQQQAINQESPGSSAVNRVRRENESTAIVSIQIRQMEL
jgi:hypothetical protein